MNRIIFGFCLLSITCAAHAVTGLGCPPMEFAELQSLTADQLQAYYCKVQWQDAQIGKYGDYTNIGPATVSCMEERMRIRRVARAKRPADPRAADFECK